MESKSDSPTNLTVTLAPHILLDTVDFDDVHEGVPTAVWLTGAPVFWNQNITGDKIVVGILDTGIDDTHPDLQGKFHLPRRDFVMDDADPSEFHFHGTHVAGTIAANGTIKGVAPKASLIDYRVLDKNGRGSNSSIIKAINQAVDDGCHIINMSLGGELDDRQLRKAVENAFNKGVLVVAAAGNDGDIRPEPQPSFPGNYNQALCVGAIDFDRSRGGITKLLFSSRNDQVDVAADGFEALSTAPNGQYKTASGTSMATPVIAGFAALLLQKYLLMASADPILPRDRSMERVRILYSLIKGYTVDVLEPGNDRSVGAGLVTAYPELPIRDGWRKWILPRMPAGEPLPGTASTMDSFAVKLKPCNESLMKFKPEVGARERERELPVLFELVSMLGEGFLSKLASPAMKVSQPCKGAWLITSQNANWGSFSGQVISCYFNADRNHYATTEGRTGVKRVNAGPGHWAISYQTRGMITNKACYGEY
jgi:major intracellular serine protease